MCGICGILYFDGRQVEKEVLLAMRDAMFHRGPDGKGFHIESSLGLGHRRLSIIDLSEKGNQPMLNIDRSLCVIFNGEIYNFKDLRRELEKKGHYFQSQSDTEVLLHGFEEWGEELPARLYGMFAFAIWDFKQKQLFLCRDRLGIKPLYYYLSKNKLLFASEIKALLASGVVSDMDPDAVAQNMILRYVPGQKTLFKNIKMFPPGYWAKFDNKGMHEKRCWWSLKNCSQHGQFGQKQTEERFHELLEEAVVDRLVADVPLGTFLSGGIDSATIAAMMARNSEKVVSFTFGFGKEFDETEEAKRIAGEIGADNIAHYLKKDDYQLYSECIWHLEEPLGDSIILPTYLLSQRAANDVKVVLVGDGADEILSGYIHQQAMYYFYKIRRLLGGQLFQIISRLTQFIPQMAFEKLFSYPSKLGNQGVERLYEFLRQIDEPSLAYFSLGSASTINELEKLVSPDFIDSTKAGYDLSQLYGDYLKQSSNHYLHNRLLELDLRYWTPDFTLLRMDKLTMAHSLEARVPFLDHRLVEFCMSLPPEMQMKNFIQKKLLRRRISGNKLLPERVIRRKKKSFILPLNKCFDKGFSDYIQDILSPESIKRRGIFQSDYVQTLLKKGDDGIIQSKQLMAVFAFELWARKFIDK